MPEGKSDAVKAASKSVETELRETAAAFGAAVVKAKEAGLHFSWPTNEQEIQSLVISQGDPATATRKVK